MVYVILGVTRLCLLAPWVYHIQRPWGSIYQYISIQYRNIGKIRRFLNTDTSKSAIISLVTARLDNCNRLLCELAEELLCKLQKVSNNAARLVSGSRKFDYIIFTGCPSVKGLSSWFCFWLSNACRDVPLYTWGTVSQTCQYKDSEMKHSELVTDSTH